MAANLSLIKKDTVDVVAAKIRQFQQSGELHLPANYSAENAMKSAWLILQSTVDKNGKPALEICTKDSIANALLDMVVQGLNPAKKQCYFIVYGNKLVCQRSYFGSMHLAKEVAGAKDIYAAVVYQGDDFEYAIERGRKRILKHVQKIENIRNDKIIAAYCVIEFGDDRPPYTEIMTIDQIRQAWKQSQLYREDGNGTHQKFTDQMAIKTVINRACKALINSSNDNNLFLRSFNRADEMVSEHEVEEEIAANANKDVLDVKFEDAPEEAEEAQETAPPEPEPSGKRKPPVKVEQQTIADGGPGF
jgi:recombination protein RecT